MEQHIHKNPTCKRHPPSLEPDKLSYPYQNEIIEFSISCGMWGKIICANYLKIIVFEPEITTKGKKVMFF